MRFQSDRIEPKGDTPELEYEQLVKWLERDTMHSSRIRDSLRHPAFSSIVSMGRDAIPWILRGGWNWWKFEAVVAIVGSQPDVPKDSAGRFPHLVKIFDEWIKDKLP